MPSAGSSNHSQGATASARRPSSIGMLRYTVCRGGLWPPALPTPAAPGQAIAALRALPPLLKGCARRRVSRPTAPEGRLLGRDERGRQSAVEGFLAGTPNHPSAGADAPTGPSPDRPPTGHGAPCQPGWPVKPTHRPRRPPTPSRQTNVSSAPAGRDHRKEPPWISYNGLQLPSWVNSYSPP